ncbi:hypothetical protein ACFOEE_03585 [Pseudoalteromonas fenneropenaei]|uniref:VIT domain-containing protein n=1 Tax=Pseudoalteromonas fenneropenaei TaxID=1737459 RepID=A0ABV7CG71_9GAMM
MADKAGFTAPSARHHVKFDHTPIYPPRFIAEGGTLHCECELPFDAALGDQLVVNATAVKSRRSNFSATVTINEALLNAKAVAMQLAGSGLSGEYVLQLNLHGRHGAIKNSNSFSVTVLAVESSGSVPSASSLSSPWISRVKRHAAHCVVAFLSVF